MIGTGKLVVGVVGLMAAAGLLTGAGCDPILINQNASLGGDLPGRRGSVDVVFINNTPYRAVFTAGTFDQRDQFSTPDFIQFSLDDDGVVLDGASQSGLGSLQCARVLSVGGNDMLTMIDRNLPDADLDDGSLVDGIEFFSFDEDSGESTLEGTASAVDSLLGVDFPCGAFLVYRLEFDDVGDARFRIDFELVVP